MVKSPGVRRASGEVLWQTKRSFQARDRELVARGAVSAEDLMLIKAEGVGVAPAFVGRMRN